LKTQGQPQRTSPFFGFGRSGKGTWFSLIREQKGHSTKKKQQPYIGLVLKKLAKQLTVGPNVRARGQKEGALIGK